MPTRDHSIPLIRLEEIDSTSLEARRRLASGTDIAGPTAILAHRQTGGVGRFGRHWESPVGGVWMTLIWPLGPEAGAVIDGLGLRIGLACCRAVEETLERAGCPKPVRLKWPNDVLVDGRKALGVLTEIVQPPSGRVALIGVGVNANFPGDALPPELRPIATTLADEAGCPIDPEVTLQALLRHLHRALTTRGLDDSTVRDVAARLHGVGSPAELRGADGTIIRGVLIGLTPDGRLRVRTDAGETLAPPGGELFVDS